MSDTKKTEELPGGARLVGKVGARPVYRCEDVLTASDSWPGKHSFQRFMMPGKYKGYADGDADLLVNDIALADLKENWGFVPLAEPPYSYPGLEHVGTYERVRLHVGDEKAVLAARSGWCGNVHPSFMASRKHWHTYNRAGRLALTPECLKAMLTWARDGWTDWGERRAFNGASFSCCPCQALVEKESRVWTPDGSPCLRCGLRLAGKPSEDEPEHTCQEPQKGCQVGVHHEDCEACQREADDDAPVPYLGLGTQGQCVERPGASKPKAAPILVCGDPGHVRLMLDRLSDDRGRAMKQLAAAIQECHAAGWPAALQERMGTLASHLLHAWQDLKAGWDPGPDLQKARDAHEVLGIEREWQANKVNPAEYAER